MNSHIRIALLLSLSQLGSSCVDDHANREIDQAQIAREIAADPELFRTRMIRPDVLRETQEPNQTEHEHDPPNRTDPDDSGIND